MRSSEEHGRGDGGLVVASLARVPRRRRMYRPDLLYEATSVTIGNSYALRPCKKSTEIIVGVYGSALKRYRGVRLHAFNPLSSHLTDLLSSDDPNDLRGFLTYTRGNISKEIKRLHNLPYEVFSAKRVHVIPVAPDLASQEYRFRYVMSQGTKEGLIESPRAWSGATGVHQLEHDKPLVGWWFDRTKEGNARRRGKTFGRYEHATPYQVQLSPLPAWRDNPNWRERVSEIIDDIEVRARYGCGRPVLGMKAIEAYSPMYFPPKPEKSPAPMVLGATPKARAALRAVVRVFDAAYEEASRRFREGDENAEFPPFSFPPWRPAVRGSFVPLALGFALEPG